MSDIQNSRTLSIACFLSVYGFSHALVDASCAFLLLHVIEVKADLLFFIVLYNVLAFGLQVPFGFLLDKYSRPKFAAVVGLLGVMVAFIFIGIPHLSVVLAGIGNALFHIGGGQVALNINKQKAVYPGIFVAPGGIGLALGIYLSYSHLMFNPLIFPALLLIMSVLLMFLRLPDFTPVKILSGRFNFVLGVILLIGLSIAIRSVIGLTINFPWKKDVALLVLLTMSIASGKVLGGILADWLGWMKTGLFGLLLAMPLLTFGASDPVAGLLGIFVFNFTMPVTLVAISTILPGRAGLSFGITTLALFIGAIPTFTSYKGWFNNEWAVFSLILVATIALYFGLRLILKQRIFNQKKQICK